MFGSTLQWNHLVWALCIARLWITKSITLLVVDLFRFCFFIIVMIVSMSLEVYLFILGYPICQHMIILLFPKSVHRVWKRELQCPESLGEQGAHPVLFFLACWEELFLAGQFPLGGQLCWLNGGNDTGKIKLSLLPLMGLFSGLLFHCVAKISEMKSRALLVHALSFWGFGWGRQGACGWSLLHHHLGL